MCRGTRARVDASSARPYSLDTKSIEIVGMFQLPTELVLPARGALPVCGAVSLRSPSLAGLQQADDMEQECQGSEQSIGACEWEFWVLKEWYSL